MTDQTDGLAPADDSLLPQDAADTSAEASQDASAEASGDDPAAATDEAPKGKKTAQDRIDELTRARRDAERDAEYWRSKALQDSKPAEPAAAAADPTKPVLESYDTYEDFVEALTDWKLAKRQEADAAERSQRDAAQAWQAKVQQATAKHPDFHEVVMESRWDCTQEMAQAMNSSEAGTEVAYHLAKNPTEARRIAGLSPIAQVLEIGRLEARLSAPATPQPKTATTAPEPAPQVRGAGGKFKVAADTNDFKSFEAAYS